MTGDLFSALEDYQQRLLTDMADALPHVVFMIAVNGIDPPRLAACARDGHVYQFEHMRTHAAESLETSRSAWTFEDLDEGSQMLSDFASAIRFGKTPPAAVEYAAHQRQSRKDWATERVMKAAAHEVAHSFECVCRRRFTTSRGLAIHRRACWKVKAQDSEVAQSP